MCVVFRRCRGFWWFLAKTEGSCTFRTTSVTTSETLRYVCLCFLISLCLSACLVLAIGACVLPTFWKLEVRCTNQLNHLPFLSSFLFSLSFFSCLLFHFSLCPFYPAMISGERCAGQTNFYAFRLKNVCFCSIDINFVNYFGKWIPDFSCSFHSTVLVSRSWRGPIHC